MEINIKVLKDLVEAVGAAGDAIAKLADGIGHLIATGVKGYDAARARKVYKGLKEASADYVVLSSTQVPMRDALLEYGDRMRRVSHENLSERRLSNEWKIVAGEASRLLEQVSHLLIEIRRDRSDFVLAGC